MSLLAGFKGKGQSGFGWANTAEEVTADLDLTGQTMLVTGSNSGIGNETARVLAKRGAHVIAAAQTIEKARQACDEIGGNTTPVACELSEPSSVRSCAQTVADIGQFDSIICNAGIMALPQLEQQHGYEAQFFTNHIGHFILVNSLLQNLKDNGRVVVLSSSAHKSAPREGIQFDNLTGDNGYRSIAAYGQSKLANLLFARELAKRLEGTTKTANSVHPGVIHTNLARNMNPVVRGVIALTAPLMLKTIPQGAATQCYVSTHPSLADVSGQYFADCNESTTSRNGRDEAMAAKLWEVSEEIVAQLN